MKLSLKKAKFKESKYMHFETNQLGPLVEKLYGKGSQNNIWDLIGSDAVMINLDDIDGSNMILVDSDGDSVLENHFVLPIKDEAKALAFKEKCDALGMEVEIGTHDEALTIWKILKSMKPTPQETV